VKVLSKTVFRVARYSDSKYELPNYEDDKTSLSGQAISFSPSFPSSAWMSRLRPVHTAVGGTNPRRDCHARPGRKVRKSIMSLDKSETLCPSRIRPARQVLFHFLFFQRGVPRTVKASLLEVRKISQSVSYPVSK
jgi:hypothetical protein